MVNDTLDKLAIVILRTITLDECHFLGLRLIVYFTKIMQFQKILFTAKKSFNKMSFTAKSWQL